MNVLDLFSGIGGFSIGLERAGMRTVAFCEIDPYCQAVLRKHWPDVPIFGDIRELAAEVLADADGGRRQEREERDSYSPQPEFPTSQRDDANRCNIDVICGGFPCQDISFAGRGAGIEGSRSGLWSEYARIIGEVRPRYVIVENVSALLGRGIERVLGDLAALGYDAEWHCIPASAIGAPHRRDRVWIIAYSSSERLERWLRTSLQECAEQRFAWAGGFHGWDEERWFAESGMGRVAHGVPNRVDRLSSLGNAIIPQIAEIIARAIMRAGHADRD